MNEEQKNTLKNYLNSIGYKEFGGAISEQFKNEYKNVFEFEKATKGKEPWKMWTIPGSGTFDFLNRNWLKNTEFSHVASLIQANFGGTFGDAVSRQETADPAEFLKRIYLLAYGKPEEWTDEMWKASAQDYKNQLAQFNKELDDKIPQQYAPSEEIYREEKSLISAAAVGAASYYLDKDWKNAVLLGALSGGIKYGADKIEPAKGLVKQFETKVTDKNVLIGSSASLITNRILKRDMTDLAFGLPIAVAGSYVTDKVIEFAYDAYYKSIGVYLHQTTPEPPFVVDGKDMSSAIRKWMK